MNGKSNMIYCSCGGFGGNFNPLPQGYIARCSGGLPASGDNSYPNTQYEEIHCVHSCVRYKMVVERILTKEDL